MEQMYELARTAMKTFAIEKLFSSSSVNVKYLFTGRDKKRHEAVLAINDVAENLLIALIWSRSRQLMEKNSFVHNMTIVPVGQATVIRTDCTYSIPQSQL